MFIIIHNIYQISLSQSIDIYNQDTINRIGDNNLKQGHCIFFGRMKKLPNYADDVKVKEGKFIDNKKKTGRWISYFSKGIISSEITYQNRRPNSYYINYYQNVKIQRKRNIDK